LIERIEIPSNVDRMEIPQKIAQWVQEARQRIEAFQDVWDRPLVEQFVAADYELVYQSLAWTRENVPMIGNRFLEWGCGFAVISALASSLGFDTVGIEAEKELLRQARDLLRRWDLNLHLHQDLVHGNFLPPGAEMLAEDPTLPSLGHEVACGYQQLGLDVDDFAIIYAYPWPGEDDFHEAVFDRYAAPGALMMQFLGPHDVRLWRKKRAAFD